MPTNQTANYALSQWVKSDQAQMEDFNADNAKIDAAIKAEADARAALAGQLSQKGNCGIHLTSYVGTGTDINSGSSNSLTLPVAPEALFICGHTGTGVMIRGSGRYTVTYSTSNGGGYVSWSEDGKSISWYSGNAGNQLNKKDETYRVVALYSV